MKPFNNQQSFTLIELLIVIGIIVTLSAVVVLVTNPVEFLRQSRDSRRLTELQSLNSALSLAEINGLDMGSSNKVYVSIPSSYSDCSDLGLPSLPSGWSYGCQTSANYQKVDGNGWIPVNFTSISSGSPLSILPVDPVNSISTGNYYTYVKGGSHELTALLESDKHSDKAINDGDAYPGIYSLRNSQSPLTPGIRDKGLVGYWKFDEGSGTVAGDSSGSGNNGTLYNSPTWTSGQVNGALSFDGGDDYVKIDDVIISNPTSLTISSWFKKQGEGSNYECVLHQSSDTTIGNSSYWMGVDLDDYFTATIGARTGVGWAAGKTNIKPTLGEWNHLLASWDGSVVKVYINGDYIKQYSLSTYSNLTTPTRMGASSNGSNYQFNGLIDEVRIYNRALSAAEIAAIYNATK